MAIILHITSRADWEAGRARGSYRAASLDREGFLHCSTPAQVVASADRYFRGRGDLVLLCIDEALVTAPLRYEPPAVIGGAEARTGELFPHLYGPLDLAAVVEVVPLPCNADGTFALPARAVWTAVDRYFEDCFAAPDTRDDALAAAVAASAAAGLPAIQVSAIQGKLLELLARLVRARRILEVGTLGGYSAIWLAGALAPGGTLVTLELEPHHAEVARANLARANLAGVVEVRVGPALDSLAALVAEAGPPFDLVFIDADKPNNPAYLARALELTAPGSVIIVDNVVRDGKVADPATTDPRVIGSQRCLDQIARDPRLCATALQTVGSKGYDGFAIAYRVA